MPAVVLDMSEFTRAAKRMHHLGKSQVPFALKNAINNGLFDARTEVVNKTFPASFDVHNKGFARGTFRVEKASKATLSGSLYDSLGRGHLEKHAEGGTKTAGSGMLAVPGDTIRKFRGPRGIRKNKRPKAFKASKTIRITKQGIFRGVDGDLVPLYIFKKSVRLKARFPFYPVFERVVVASIRKNFPAQLKRALKSAR